MSGGHPHMFWMQNDRPPALTPSYLRASAGVAFVTNKSLIKPKVMDFGR